MSRKGPSDVSQYGSDIIRAQMGAMMPMETEPRYELPGALTKQGPAQPGNPLEQYGYKRYYRSDWGLQSGGGGHGSKFAGAYSFFTYAFVVAEDVYALQIGPNSEAAAVKIWTAGSEQPLVVSVGTPLIAPIKGPFWVSPQKAGVFAHKMELLTYTRAPMQMFPGRAPLFYQNIAADATIQYAPCYGRKNIRVTVDAGAGNSVTIQYHQFVNPDQALNGPISNPSPGAAFGGGDVIIGQETSTTGIITRDTQLSSMFPASSYDVFGVSVSTFPSMIQIEAFD